MVKQKPTPITKDDLNQVRQPSSLEAFHRYGIIHSHEPSERRAESFIERSKEDEDFDDNGYDDRATPLDKLFR